MNRPIRLADVATAAGVSQGTASNAFNRPELVRAEIRERVLKEAARLGYSGPDPRGRLLRAGKVNAIGVVVMGRLTYFFNDPFNREFMEGLSEVCDEAGAGVSLISAADQKAAAWSIETAVVDGFIVQCIEDGDRLIELAKRRKLPFVAVDLDAGPDASSIRLEDRKGAREAAEHLIGLGHRNIAILTLELRDDGHTGPVTPERRQSAHYGVTRDRLLGYEDAFRAAGIDIDKVPIFESFNDRSAEEQAARLLDAAPQTTAVLALSDVLGLATIKEATGRGLSVPHDLSVVGFDDVPEAARAVPPLTTMAQPVIEKGRLAARMILERRAPQQIVLPVKLVIRGSTAPPRGRR